MDRAPSVEVRAVGVVVLGKRVVGVEVDTEPVRELVRVASLVLTPRDALDARLARARARAKRPPVAQIRLREAQPAHLVSHSDVISREPSRATR